MDETFIGVEEFHEGSHAALIAEAFLLDLVGIAAVGQGDAQTGGQERRFAQERFQGIVIVDRVFKHFRIGLEGDGRTGFFLFTDLFDKLASGELTK